MEMRSIGPESVEVIRQLMHRIYPPAYSAFWQDNGAWYLANKYNREYLLKEWATPDIEVAGIFIDNQLVGYYKNIRKYLTTLGPSLGLERLYLGPEVQGKGIGSKAIEYTLQRARIHNCRLIWVEAMTRSRAYSFYERFGFREVSRLELDFPGMEAGYRTLATMHLELNHSA